MQSAVYITIALLVSTQNISFDHIMLHLNKAQSDVFQLMHQLYKIQSSIQLSQKIEQCMLVFC